MRRTILSTLALLAFAGAALAQTPPAGAPPAAGRGGPRPPPLMMSSTAFPDGGVVPDKYTAVAGAAAVTPPLAWANTPAGTQSFVLIVHDVDVVMGRGLGDNPHWVLFNIPATATSLAEGLPPTPTLPDGTVQLARKNAQGVVQSVGYFAFAPPPGFVHHYNFDLYALDIKLPLDANASRADVEKALDGHVIGKAVMETLFKR